MSGGPILEVRGLTVRFGSVTAVNDLSFSLHAGKTLAIVGESGSGKSVTALSIMRLVHLGSQGRIVDGEILFRTDGGGVVDLCSLREDELSVIRGSAISMIFQEPLTCLNPLYPVVEQIAETLRRHKGMGRKAARRRAIELMESVRIPDARLRAGEYPHQMSGGMRQRVMIAMAMACQPRVLIADEPTSALDVTIQAQILRLIADLSEELGVSVIFITHDMGVVAEIADEMLVMRRSVVVESGPVAEIFARPKHPYTQALLSAVPRLGSMTGTDRPARFELAGEIVE